MLEVFRGDIFSNIEVHFDIIDLYNYKLTCKYFNNNSSSCKNVIRTMTNNKLKYIFADETSNFINLLEKMGGIISGSFVLQTIFNEHYDDSDIDIYIPLKNNSRNLTKNGITCTKMENFIYGICSGYCGSEFKDYPDPRDNCPSLIRFVRDYTITSHNGSIVKYEETLKITNRKNIYQNIHSLVELNYMTHNKIQIILVDCDKSEMINFINKESDFSICKNAIYYKDTIPHYYHNDINGIITKTTKFSYSYNKLLSLKRKEKYENRGFKFI